MISVKNLCLKFTKEYYALYDINIDIKKGDVVAFFGEKNSGKTTLLRVLTKLEKFSSGEVYIKDISVDKVDFKYDIQMGYIPRQPLFVTGSVFNRGRLTVYEELKHILKNRNFCQADIENMINQVLINYNIEKLRDERITDLTLFEKYVVSIARLSLRKIELVLIDDIFEKLTESEKTKIKELIKNDFIDKKVTTVFATKDINIAKQLAKKVITFNNGSIEN